MCLIELCTYMKSCVTVCPGRWKGPGAVAPPHETRCRYWYITTIIQARLARVELPFPLHPGPSHRFRVDGGNHHGLAVASKAISQHRGHHGVPVWNVLPGETEHGSMAGGETT